MAVKRAWSSSSGASVPDKTSDPVPPSAYLMELVRFAEWLSYRTLIVIALIGFANAVPVVRELIETVF